MRPTTPSPRFCWAGGCVSFLVGGVGLANIMVISVPERRNEIGLQRVLGATMGHVAVQFLEEVLWTTWG
jgi:putative ABC transport system permease protein